VDGSVPDREVVPWGGRKLETEIAVLGEKTDLGWRTRFDHAEMMLQFENSLLGTMPSLSYFQAQLFLSKLKMISEFQGDKADRRYRYLRNNYIPGHPCVQIPGSAPSTSVNKQNKPTNQHLES
jgi:hypothetical protein